ncbi:unnamed protein product [Colias eurytheme]|nr:unnamed protein product [Colias eurytheme]
MYRVRYRAISAAGGGAGTGERIRVGLTARPRRVAVRALTSPLDNGCRRPVPSAPPADPAQSLVNPRPQRVLLNAAALLRYM